MKKLDHIAIAVPDLTAAVEQYKNALGVTISAPQELPEHGVRIVFVKLQNATIELMESFGEGSPIAAFLERNPSGGIHHFCLGDPEFDTTLARVKDSGARALGEPKIGAHGNPVMFLHPKDFQGTLIELEKIAE